MTTTLAAQAKAIADAGDIERAHALLEAAGARGDVDALMELGVWALTGRYRPRDPTAARTWIRRAVEIGHVDGALMEIALTANGTGGEPDWARALGLLRAAAEADYVAAAQLALVEAMKLTPDGRPTSIPTPQLLSDSPRVVLYPALLTPEECAHIATKASEGLAPARVIDPTTGKLIAHPVRTSHEAAIGPAHEDLVIRAINLRVAAISDTDVDQGEVLTTLRYTPGQQYRPHLDTIGGASNQRIRTVLLYLNEAFRGGETQFQLLDLTFRPRGGDALMFDTLLADGRPDERARHAGLPVTDGAKWVATRWIRREPFDSWTS